MIAQRNVRRTIKFLEKNGVQYLDYTAFNEKEFDNRFMQQYEILYQKVIVKKLFKHFDILPLNNEAIFNFFEKNNGKWYGVFYEPDVIFELNKVLKNDFTGLEELHDYSAATRVR